jgi:hypothetical protein
MGNLPALSPASFAAPAATKTTASSKRAMSSAVLMVDLLTHPVYLVYFTADILINTAQPFGLKGPDNHGSHRSGTPLLDIREG